MVGRVGSREKEIVKRHEGETSERGWGGRKQKSECGRRNNIDQTNSFYSILNIRKYQVADDVLYSTVRNLQLNMQRKRRVKGSFRSMRASTYLINYKITLRGLSLLTPCAASITSL